MTAPRMIWWVKRDARLHDNAVLHAAQQLRATVLPIFCWEPTIINASDYSDMHCHAQWQAVRSLRQQLRARNLDLLIAHGDVVEKLAKLHAVLPFTHMGSHEEVGNNLTYQRDRAVAQWCHEAGVSYIEFPQSSVKRGGVNRDHLQRWWQQRVVDVAPLPIPEIRQIPEETAIAQATGFPRWRAFRDHPEWQSVSEADAHATLNDFLTHRGKWYRGGISSPNTADRAGSRLSVHLAWGTISTRQIWHAVQHRLQHMDPEDPDTARWRASLHAFLSRLHWRDHFTQRLESEPELEFRSIHPSYRDVPYENAPTLQVAWEQGTTGYPLVDAVMRCLARTGFVNFRMRAMVVSFACHVLHLDWRVIHPHLARVFRDYDPGIHLNQLQMQAGVVGWNAIRVYNPTKQLQDWDNQCRFVKRWLPELRTVQAHRILHHVEEPVEHYAPPVVDFARRSQQMSKWLYSIRKTTAAIAATKAVYQKHGSRKKETSFRVRRTPKKKSKNQPTLFDD
ncbi:MAG: FAD-binding domain-containing protein [Zavarzinella sp.]